MKFDTIADAVEYYSSLLDSDDNGRLLGWFLILLYGPWGTIRYDEETLPDSDVLMRSFEESIYYHISFGLLSKFISCYADLMMASKNHAVCWREFLNEVDNVSLCYRFLEEDIHEEFFEMNSIGVSHSVYIPVDFTLLMDDENHYTSYFSPEIVDGEYEGYVEGNGMGCLWGSYIEPCLEMALGDYREDSDGDFYIPETPPSKPDPPDGEGGEDPPDDDDGDEDGSDGSDEDEGPKMPTGYKSAIEEIIDDGEKEKQETGDPGDPPPPPDPPPTYEPPPPADPPKELPKTKDSFKSFTKRLCKYV